MGRRGRSGTMDVARRTDHDLDRDRDADRTVESEAGLDRRGLSLELAADCEPVESAVTDRQAIEHQLER